MSASVGWQVKLLGFELVEVNIEIDVDDAGLFPMADSDGDAGVGQRDGGMIVGSNGVSKAVGRRRIAFAFRLRLGLDLSVGFTYETQYTFYFL